MPKRHVLRKQSRSRKSSPSKSTKKQNPRKRRGSKSRAGKRPASRTKAKTSRERTKTLYHPSTTPGVRTRVRTKNKRQRRRVGKWMAALNAAGRGDFSKMDKLPRRMVICGVRLPTDREEVQDILRALAEEETPFESLYRAVARRS